MWPFRKRRGRHAAEPDTVAEFPTCDCPDGDLPMFSGSTVAMVAREVPTDNPTPGGQVSKAKYKVREDLVTALEASGLSDNDIDDVVEAWDAKNPSAFTNTSGLSDEVLAKKALEFTRRQLRRFPNTQCALALSLKDLFAEGNTSYQP